MELTSTESAQVDAQSEEWFASYTEPSNQSSKRHRRAHHHHHRRRDPRRQQHRLTTLMMLASVVLVGAMTACFYAVLTR